MLQVAAQNSVANKKEQDLELRFCSYVQSFWLFLNKSVGVCIVHRCDTMPLVIAPCRTDSILVSDLYVTRNSRPDPSFSTHLMRLGILPTGHIYPKQQRAIRDLLHRRLSLVRVASAQLISVQSQVWRSTGIRIKSETLRRPDFKLPLMDDYTLQSAQSGLAVYYATQEEIDALEQSAYEAVKQTKAYEVLQTRDIGKILGLTIMLETGDIHRFGNAGKFASYCRCVDSTRTSNGKKKGKGKAMLRQATKSLLDFF